MKMITPFLAGCILFAGAALAATDNFDDAKIGPLPTHWDGKWTGTQTGHGTANWSIAKDDSAPSKPHVLKQSGEAEYSLALKNDIALKDGFVEVKFKPVSGKEDQAGGVVWRAKDANNYYLARANALEDNVTIYHTIGGRRVSFKSIGTKVASGAWHTLRVDFKSNQFAVTFDGQKVIEASDGSFTDAGKVGVWTKADSVTLFDDFSYSEK
jgi:hypothetical protein